MKHQIDINLANDRLLERHRRDFDYLAEQLSERGIDAEGIVEQVRRFKVAIPSWALGTGGTRFGRFPREGEPRNVFEKVDDVAVVSRLTGTAPDISLHIPWDEPDDPDELAGYTREAGLSIDAVNSNTFQDQAGQALSYKFGSLAHTREDVRNQAVEHHLHVIEVGKKLGSTALSVWLADGSNHPGQMHLRKGYERVLDGLHTVYRHLPEGWRMFTEHKPYEPAFYSTVVADWGSSLLLAQALGDRAQCLVDLGHHLPNTNIEQIVARLVTAGKLGGFHFNDSKYGDDDLTTGSIKPYQLFLIFNELVDAAVEGLVGNELSYMLDQSHNLKDPVEDLIQSVVALQRAYAQALLVRRDALTVYQEENDPVMAEEALKEAFFENVNPIISEARLRQGAALDPIGVFRSSGYREAKAAERGLGSYAPPKSL